MLVCMCVCYLDSLSNKLIRKRKINRQARKQTRIKNLIKLVSWLPWPSAGDTVRIVRRAHGVQDAFRVDRADKVGPDAYRAENAETGEQEIPGDERSSQIEASSSSHVRLADENQGHIDERVVDARVPVLAHPFAFRFDELVVEEFALKK